MGRVVVGNVKGTGVSLDVSGDKVGFRPKAVRLVNVTDGSVADWTADMPAAAMAKEKAGTHTYVTTGGVTALASGFNLGADTDMNASGDSIFFVAFE